MFCELGGPPVAAVRAVAVLYPRVAGTEAHVRRVLLAAVRARAGVRAALAPAAARHEALAAACALVAMYHCASRDGAGLRAPIDLHIAGRRGLLVRLRLPARVGV